MFLLAPGRYFPLAQSDPPAVLPLPGVPSTVVGVADLHNDWDSQVQCKDQFSPGIRDAINWTTLTFDPLGSTWGTEGVRRAPVWNSPPGSLYWGWNTKLVNQLKPPTLIIRGDLDTTVPLGDIQAFIGDLVAVQQKVFVHVACASHYLQWENQHEILLRASVEWLQQGTFNGLSNGSFGVDAAGQVRREQ